MENSAQFDEAAKKADAEYPTTGSAQDVALWWAKWYGQAGHKRLGRIVVQKAKTPAPVPA